MEAAEVVLDIAEVPFIPFGNLRTTTVDKIKMSDSHNMLAFTVDIENTEIMTGGIKDLAKNEYLPHFVFNQVHTMEFGAGEDPRFLYYTEATKQENRPWRVMRVDLKTGNKVVIYEDTDPTHYVDLGVTKDKQFLVISSNTKEDSEVLVLRRGEECEANNSKPSVLLPRRAEVRAHVDHIRDFFVVISNVSTEDHSFRVASMADSELDKDASEARKWMDLLDPKLASDDLLIAEVDAFKDFIAVYCKRDGKPEIIVQDLDSQKFSTINVNDDVGAIAAGMNQEYESKLLNFNFQSPFVYM